MSSLRFTISNTFLNPSFLLSKIWSLTLVLLQVVVVQAISALCQKYPRKHSVMMNFLSNMLRDDVSGIVLHTKNVLEK